MAIDKDESDRNLGVIRKLYEHFQAREWDAVTDLLDPAIVTVEAPSLPYGGRYEGRDGFMKVVQALGASFDDLTLSDFDFVASGDAVIALFRVRATGRATKLAIDVRFAEHWRLKNGRAILLEPYYFDTHQVCVALGAA